MDGSEHVARIDRETVSTVARRVLGRPNASIVHWHARVAYGGFGVVAGTSCVLRVAGEAADEGRTWPWSAYVKIVRVPPPEAAHVHDPADDAYWRREIDAYESGVLGQLPDGMAAPRCFAVVRRVWAHLWLEDVQDDGEPWSVERYGLAGCLFGRFNGQYLSGRPLPTEPWLSRTFLRALAPTAAGRSGSGWTRCARTSALRGGPARRHGRAGASAVRGAPRAPRPPRPPAADVVHQDAYHRNLMARAGTPGEPRSSLSIGPGRASPRSGPTSRPWCSATSSGATESARTTCPRWTRPPSTAT